MGDVRMDEKEESAVHDIKEKPMNSYGKQHGTDDGNCLKCHTFHGSNRACPDKSAYCANCGSPVIAPDLGKLAKDIVHLVYNERDLHYTREVVTSDVFRLLKRPNE